MIETSPHSPTHARLAEAVKERTMYLLRVPDEGPSSCVPIDPLEVRFEPNTADHAELQVGLRIKQGFREPMVWRWHSRLGGSGVSALGATPDEAWERVARFERSAHA